MFSTAKGRKCFAKRVLKKKKKLGNNFNKLQQPYCCWQRGYIWSHKNKGTKSTSDRKWIYCSHDHTEHCDICQTMKTILLSFTFGWLKFISYATMCPNFVNIQSYACSLIAYISTRRVHVGAIKKSD